MYGTRHCVLLPNPLRSAPTCSVVLSPQVPKRATPAQYELYVPSTDTWKPLYRCGCDCSVATTLARTNSWWSVVPKSWSDTAENWGNRGRVWGKEEWRWANMTR